MSSILPRRDFLRSCAAIGASLAVGPPAPATQHIGGGGQICAFIKFIQSLSYDKLADAMSEIGFDGIEATVRRGGYIQPPRAVDELPKLVEALAKRNVKITMITTDINRADDPQTEPLLRTAAGLGIPMYRMRYYNYDLKRPVMDQLTAIRPILKELAALNRELGIQAVYQNHAGAKNVGSMLWDLHSQLEDIPVEQIAFAFDIRHATVEAGLSWPTVYNAMRPRIACVYAKDFDWVGRRAEHVPLGKGRIDRDFFTRLQADKFQGPISLHVEYLEDGTVEENLAALRRDFGVLRGWLES
jgi:sugar phosphate isomerase/epimerase